MTKGPTLEELKAKVDLASKRGPTGPSLGPMTHEERDEYLFGIKHEKP